MTKRRIKIALLAAAGGHFEQLTNLKEFYEKYDHFWITGQNKQTETALRNEKKFFISPGHFKNPWTYLPHFPIITKVFIKEKPTHIISTGSGRVSLIPYLLSKLFGIKFIFIETYSRVNNLTKFAEFLLKREHTVHTQWENDIDGVEYIGPIFGVSNTTSNNSIDGDYIFVALGTRREPFTRILDYLESLKHKGVLKEKIIVQAGHTEYDSEHMEIFDYCSVAKIDELIKNAKYVITQESAGIATKCLKFNKKFIEMPRDYEYGELPAKSDMQEDLQYRLEELGYTKVVNNEDELETAIIGIYNLKTGFKFDNSKAISTLKNLVEN
jgi:UDP-N-acetylglucosamine transferase subunit ALG13